VFSTPKLPERYIRGDLVILLDLSTDDCQLGASQRLTLRITSGEPNNFSGSSSGENNVGRTTDHQQKFPMFIDAIHFVNDGEDVIIRVDSVVERLEIADHVSHLRVRDPLYVSLKTGQFIVRGRNGCNNRKGDISRFSPRLCARKNPNEVVEARPQVMNDLADQDTESHGNGESLMILNRILPRLVVWVWDGGVFAVPKEPLDLPFKVEDTLIGPF